MRADGLLKMISFDARGKFARAGGFGRVTFGYNYFGFYSIYAGIYSKKYYYGRPYISKMKFYRPTNPRTTKQQNWRSIHAYGTYLWQNLTLEIKQIYNQRAKKKKIEGYNLFMSEWLKPATSGFGKIIFSHNGFGGY